MGDLFYFLLPQDKLLMKSTSGLLYLHQTIPSDCIKPPMGNTLCNEVTMQMQRIMGTLTLGWGHHYIMTLLVPSLAKHQIT